MTVFTPDICVKYALRALRVGLPAANAAATGSADRHRRKELAGTAVTQAGEFADDLVEPRVDIISELDFHDRSEAIDAQPDRGRDDSALRDGRIDHAVLPVFFLQAVRAPENTAEIADVLPECDHTGVFFQHHVVGRADGLDHAHLAHQDSPRIFRSFSCCFLRCSGISANTSSNISFTSRKGGSVMVP